MIMQYSALRVHCYILERGDVVESDHAAIGVDVEWNMKIRGGEREKLAEKEADSE